MRPRPRGLASPQQSRAINVLRREFSMLFLPVDARPHQHLCTILLTSVQRAAVREARTVEPLQIKRADTCAAAPASGHPAALATDRVHHSHLPPRGTACTASGQLDAFLPSPQINQGDPSEFPWSCRSGNTHVPTEGHEPHASPVAVPGCPAGHPCGVHWALLRFCPVDWRL